MSRPYDSIRPIKWLDDGLWLLDQRLLPMEETWLCFNTCSDVSRAIKDMVVRGAPAIGITAAYAAVLSAKDHVRISRPNWREKFASDMQALKKARPTAVNLAWAVEQMESEASVCSDENVERRLLSLACRVEREDIEANYRIGELGDALLPGKTTILTHCNAGALATGGYGTALGVVRAAAESGKLDQVFADETRPWFQGSRLTAWELLKEGIDVNVIADSSAAYMMAKGKVNAVVVGADRIAANGDVANKVGTYALSVQAKVHGVKFIVAAPTSTIDMNTKTGADIPIEERSEDELLMFGGARLAPSGGRAMNPVFDITPAKNVDHIVTELGVVSAPDTESIKCLMEGA